MRYPRIELLDRFAAVRAWSLALAAPLAGHSRVSYRFFPPAARWQFIGLRLARDI